jgi:alpha-beta hydrolase superfamily lysophospholipase
MPVLKSLSIPVIIGIGERDASVPAESARDLQRQFTAAGKNNAHVHIYPRADHRLATSARPYRTDFFGGLVRCVGGKCSDQMP